MKNETTPAMKEVETVEQAAKRHCEIEHAKNSDDNFHTHIETYYRVHAPYFIAGAKWREENPVNPMPEAQPLEGVKTAEEIKPVSLGIANGIDPCPFCGGKEGETVFIGYKEPRYLISCTTCNVRLIDDRKDKVQAKWNLRNGITFWDQQSWAKAYHAQFATDAGGEKDFVQRVYDICSKRNMPTEGEIQSLEIEAFNILEKAPSTHSSSEMVSKEKVLAIIDNAGYIDVEFRINLTSQINLI